MAGWDGDGLCCDCFLDMCECICVQSTEYYVYVCTECVRSTYVCGSIRKSVSCVLGSVQVNVVCVCVCVPVFPLQPPSKEEALLYYRAGRTT